MNDHAKYKVNVVSNGSKIETLGREIPEWGLRCTNVWRFIFLSVRSYHGVQMRSNNEQLAKKRLKQKLHHRVLKSRLTFCLTILDNLNGIQKWPKRNEVGRKGQNKATIVGSNGKTSWFLTWAMFKRINLDCTFKSCSKLQTSMENRQKINQQASHVAKKHVCPQIPKESILIPL